MRVYYLTEPLYGLSNLALHRVKIARFADLNDPFELLAVDRRKKIYAMQFEGQRKILIIAKVLYVFVNRGAIH